jgi:hypothetical protein
MLLQVICSYLVLLGLLDLFLRIALEYLQTVNMFVMEY